MKILVIRFQQIGDSILGSVICNSLKETFPDSTIDYVLYEHVSSIFENHKSIDKVISISKKEWLANKNPRHQGVEPKEFNITKGMTRDEIYHLITPKHVVSKVIEIYNNCEKD